jgi:hypothetical protein
MPLQIRRGPTADRLANTPLAGELVYDTTTGSVYVGNGTTAGGLPVTNFSVGDARSTTAKMFLGEYLSDNSVHSGVTFAYIGDRLQLTVAQDLSNYIGLIAADQGFKGNLWADDSGQIIDSATKTIYGNLIAEGDILPDSNETHDIGSLTKRFKDLYLSGSSIYLGDAVITAVDTAVNLPLGTTVAGQPLGINEGDTYNITISGNVIGTDSTVLVDTANGTFHGDLTGSVFADDSTILVDGRDGVLRGTLIGALTGNVTGDLTGTASSATIASTVTLVPTNTSASVHYLAFTVNSSGDESVRSDTSLTYQPSTNTLATGTLNVSTVNTTTVNATSVSATNITGNIFTSLIDTADSSAITVTPAIVFSGDVTVENELFIGGDVFPDTSESYNLGSYTRKFGKLYLTEGNNALWIGNAAISGSGTTVNLPAGSTVGGSAITTAAGANATTITVNTTGTSADHFVSFFDDQTGDNLIYTDDTFKYNPGTGVLTVGDATIGTVTGNLSGNVTGSLFGNADTATAASTVTLTATNSTAATHFVTFTDTATGNENLRTDTDLTYNPSTNTLTTNLNSTGTSAFVNITSTGAATLATGSFNTSTGSGGSMLGVTQAHTTVDARNVTFARGRGSITVPTIVNNGDDIADIVFAGYGVGGYIAGAQLSVIVEDSAPSAVSMKSRMVLSTNNGTTLVDHVTLDSNGVLTVNTFSSGSIQIVENTITTLASNDDIVFDPSGTGTVEFIVPAQDSVGSAGLASALPATPAKYFKIKLNGVEYVVPAYAVS